MRRKQNQSFKSDLFIIEDEKSKKKKNLSELSLIFFLNKIFKILKRDFMNQQKHMH